MRWGKFILLSGVASLRVTRRHWLKEVGGGSRRNCGWKITRKNLVDWMDVFFGVVVKCPQAGKGAQRREEPEGVSG